MAEILPSPIHGLLDARTIRQRLIRTTVSKHHRQQHMRRRGKLDWYDVVFFAIAAVIVFPDKVLDWIGEHTGLAFNWRHIVALEVIAISGLIGFTALLMPHYPTVEWWYPAAAVGFVGLMRLILSMIVGLFGFDD